jgi:hypothetical protein
MMPDVRDSLKDLHSRLGYKPLRRSWAKAEILFGLSAAGAGVLLGVWAVSRPVIDGFLATGALALWVLGGYLALAGNRSHLYQSGNERTAFLAEAIRRLQDKD